MFGLTCAVALWNLGREVGTSGFNRGVVGMGYNFAEKWQRGSLSPFFFFGGTTKRRRRIRDRDRELLIVYLFASSITVDTVLIAALQKFFIFIFHSIYSKIRTKFYGRQ